jgi:glutaminase
MAGGEMLEFNNSIFLSERASIDRDYALAHFMRENKCFPPGANIKNILDFYFQVTIRRVNEL